MFKFFKISREKKGKSPHPLLRDDAGVEDIPRYPPFVEGLPVSSVENIFQTQIELIQRIREVLSFNDEMYEKHLLPVIYNYINFVHLLPASEAHHHRGAGGLFRHGLEVGFYAAQFSEGMILANYGTQEQRRNSEPRWRFAAFLTGMHHDDGKPVSDVSITDKTGNLTWLPLSETLFEWAQENQISNYYLRWRNNRHKRHEKMSLQVAQRLIPKETWAYLSEDGNHQIPEMMVDAIAGMSTTQPLAKLMMRADQTSVEKDLKEFRGSLDKFTYGIPIERYIFDTIRGLINKKKWKVNEMGGAVWHTKAGTFLAWKQHIGQFNTEIAELKIPGIPKDADVLADILIERGLAVPKPIPGTESTYRYWQVRLNVESKEQNIQSGSVRLILLRIESPGLIFSTEPSSLCDAIILNNEEGQEESTHSVDSIESDSQLPATEPAAINIEPKSIVETKPILKPEPESKPVSIPKYDNIALKELSPSVEKQPVKTLESVLANPTPQAVNTDLIKDVLPTTEASKKPKKQKLEDLLNNAIAEINEKKKADALNEAVIPSAVKSTSPLKVPSNVKEDTQALNNTAAGGTSYKNLLDYLDVRHSKSRIFIEKSVSLLIDREIMLGEVLSKKNADIYIKYPSGADKLGAYFDLKAIDILLIFAQSGVLIKDLASDRPLVNFDGGKVMLLNPAVSSQVIKVLEENEAKIEQSLLDGQQNSLVENEIKVEVSSINQGHNKVFPGEYQSDSDAPKQSLESKLTARLVTVEEIIEDLRAQVAKGSGRWLNGIQVKETADYRIIPISILDQIEIEYPYIAKSFLRFTISTKRPREHHIDNSEILFKK